jgi:hypothetical protein
MSTHGSSHSFPTFFKSFLRFSPLHCYPRDFIHGYWDKTGLDRFAQPYLIGNQVSTRRSGGNTMGEYHLVRQQVNACGGKSRGALHDWQDVCFVGKPRLACSIRRPSHIGQDALGTGLFAPNRCNRYSAFTGSEENPEVILFWGFNDDTFPEFRMDDPFAECEKTTMPW